MVFPPPTLGQIKGLVFLSPLTLAARLATGIPHGDEISSHQSSRTDKLGEPGTEFSFGGR